MIDSRGKPKGPRLYTPDDIAHISGSAVLGYDVLDEVLGLIEHDADPADIYQSCLEKIVAASLKPSMVAVRGRDGEWFGRACSINVDHEVSHARHDAPLVQGQLVTVDMIAVNDGWWYVDLAETVVVGGGGHPLLEALGAVWSAALATIGPGVAWAEVATAMAEAASDHDARMVRGLAGHGIGFAPHELPMLPLVPRPSDPPVILRPGMVFTLEPAITSGSGETVDSEDGWAILTADGAPSVGREAMIAIDADGFRVLGGSANDDS